MFIKKMLFVLCWVYFCVAIWPEPLLSGKDQGKAKFEIFEDPSYPYELSKEVKHPEIKTTKGEKSASRPSAPRVSYTLGDKESIDAVVVVFAFQLPTNKSLMNGIRFIQERMESSFSDIKAKPKLTTSRDKIDGEKYYYFEIIGKWKLKNQQVYAKCYFIKNGEYVITFIFAQSVEFYKKLDKHSKELRKAMSDIVHSYRSTRKK